MNVPAAWSNYQVVIDGKPKLLPELTIDELRRELVQAINALESVDSHAPATVDRIEKWRNGGR